jgi:hypothetical protein
LRYGLAHVDLDLREAAPAPRLLLGRVGELDQDRQSM